MKSAGAIAFDWRPSRRLRSALIGVTALAVAAVWLSAMRQWPLLAGVLSVACIGACVHWLRRGQGQVWRRVAWNVDGSWSLSNGDHAVTTAQLTQWRSLGAGVVVLLLSDRGARIPLLMLSDNVDADTRRRLRVRLAQHRHAAPSWPS